MLKGWRVVMFAMLVWGNLSFAALPTGNVGQTDSRQDLQTISSWMAHLNFYYPELQAEPSSEADLQNPSARQELMQELKDLEQSLGNGANLPDASLKQIACGRPECNGGGGGGKCSTCEVDKE